MICIFETWNLERSDFLEALFKENNVSFEIEQLRGGRYTKYKFLVSEVDKEKASALLKANIAQVIDASNPFRALVMGFIVIVAAMLLGMRFLK